MPSSPFRRILVPHDFSAAADHALRQAAALARAARGRLRVLHVLEPMYVPINVPGQALPDPYALVPTQQAALEQHVRKLLGSGAPPFTVEVRVAQPTVAILEAARRADSIVMSTHGRTGLRHLLLGSVAERVVRASPIPVLTVRPTPSRRARKPRPSRTRRAA
ncbi:MAG: universal stress protein [bacterium]|nr:universal stress protein [bacterium]